LCVFGFNRIISDGGPLGTSACDMQVLSILVRVVSALVDR